MTDLIHDYAPLFQQDVPLLDLRAPVEFAEGAFPTAVNLPLMTDEERAAVGTCYKQQGQAAAIALGHSLVNGAIKAQRLQAWRDFFDHHPHGVMYCFRGGMRSETVQQWLTEAGCHRPRVAGGYKALRQFLIQTLDRVATSWPLWLLTGMTGSGKTDLLAQLPAAVDLEGHARHRGSSFGALPEPQPGNIDFENGLAIELLKREAQGQRAWVLEDESRMIGTCCLPQSLYQVMEPAPLVVLEAPQEERVQRIVRQYVVELGERYARTLPPDEAHRALADYLGLALQRISRRLGDLGYRRLNARLLAALDEQARSGDTSYHQSWITPLLSDYYDPLYLRHLQIRSERILFQGEAAACRDFLLHTLTQASQTREEAPHAALLR